MRNIFVVLFYFTCFTIFAQNTLHPLHDKKVSGFSSIRNIKIEDQNGRLITDSIERKTYFEKKQQNIDFDTKISNRLSLAQTAVQMCSNSGFEEYETVSGVNVLKDFMFTEGFVQNPIQCKSVTETANQNIRQFDPNNNNLMVSTIPSNFLDEYIGNINAFDQYSLKVNYKSSNYNMGLVQAKRFKTNNETTLKFNYKAILQSITESGHNNEQPYFKARVLNKNGVVVSEFCLIGDPTNCIFTQAPNLEGGSIVLYTKNWQSGILDISSIPNNEEFTVEFMATRCGLMGHFGYAYIDDICLLHSTENSQGSIELDPLYKICPSMPISVCGNYTLPNSGGISATVTSITMKVYDNTNTVIYTTSTPLSLDLVNHKFCFNLEAANLVNVTTGNYNVGVTINYGITQTNCNGTSFASATDDDANPGWDISFMNCSSTCNFTLQTGNLELCDTNHNGKEFFNLTNANTLIAGIQPGLTFSYFTTLNHATNDTNAIANFLNYESTSTTIFVRASKDATCFKIIAIQLIVKNPTATISGILNVCSGSTTLTASPGSSYLWSNGATTQNTVVNAIGTYTVTVTDATGCVANGSVTIIANQVAVQPTIQVTQPTCFVSTGTIAITSPASEYSYDGGSTWTTNATMSNLAIGSYSIKIKTASGCISYNTSINIIPYLSSFPSYSSVNPTSCGGFGSITITTSAAAYSFDDGVTWTSNNTATNLPLGTYLIRTKDQFGCISNFNSVTFYSEFLPAPIYIANQPYCSNLGSIAITSSADQYSFDGGTTWQTSNTLSNLTAGSYIIKIKNAQGCTSPNVYVYLNNLENSYPQYTLTPAGCGTYASIAITTLGDLYSFDGGINWTTNPFITNLISNTSYSLVVKKGISCKSLTNTAYVYSAYLTIPPANDYQTTECDNLNDGSENIDLTIYNTNLIPNSTNYRFTYYNSLLGAENNTVSSQITNISSCNLNNSNNTVYVRVTNPATSCYKVAELKFNFIASPIINMLDAYPLCVNKNVIIDAGTGFYTYSWSTTETSQTISINQPGNYWVDVTENNNPLICTSRKNFNVFLSNPATINKITTQDWTNDENVITVYATGLGNYEYSIDGINYQDSNVFNDLNNGSYTVYVHDKNECGTVNDEVYLLMYPKFFTPNGDGFNDTWKIKLSYFEPGLKIKIIDRYEKFIKELQYNDSGWNGTMNGLELPSDDYWFVVTRADGKEHRGHFTLKR
ncbi:T9SS type B sorting domain-containing protein [Flavobacterium rhamnosiphilum]|uniref:T9SS type B sorting domain-containing protein n=1 Tax=Flavobacterium rhamnosiphilum TaxID=2541724 RepID=A0A4R5F7K9_9FLAO|nr:T9SS type B sorting domain-containing protein [Flavobacterium rhamnosiphilum]TDE43875.1 T9SS type B sorting domain-containing protein [Flavobacterium rhamnosiphilum]